MSSFEQQAEALRSQIRYHDRKYYAEASPEIQTLSMTGC